MSAPLPFLHTPDVTSYLRQLGYVGVFVWFTVFDFVAPFPDEVSLLTVGYLASTGVFNPFLVALVPFASFLLTDSLSFFVARGGRTLFGRVRRTKKAKHSSLRSYVSRNLERNLPGTIIAICFIPRMRVWGPIVAGSTKIPFAKFLTFDAIGVGLFVILYTNLGYFFGLSLHSLFAELRGMEESIFVGVLLVLGIVLIVISNKVAQKEHAKYHLHA